MGCLRYAPAAEPPNRRQEPSWAARRIGWQLSHQTGAVEPPNRRSGAVAQLQEVAREAVAQTACDVSMLTSRWFALWKPELPATALHTRRVCGSKGSVIAPSDALNHPASAMAR